MLGPSEEARMQFALKRNVLNLLRLYVQHLRLFHFGQVSKTRTNWNWKLEARAEAMKATALQFQAQGAVAQDAGVVLLHWEEKGRTSDLRKSPRGFVGTPYKVQHVSFFLLFTS